MPTSLIKSLLLLALIFLGSCDRISVEENPAFPKGDISRGKNLFDSYCISCHKIDNYYREDYAKDLSELDAVGLADINKEKYIYKGITRIPKNLEVFLKDKQQLIDTFITNKLKIIYDLPKKEGDPGSFPEEGYIQISDYDEHHLADLFGFINSISDQNLADLGAFIGDQSTSSSEPLNWPAPTPESYDSGKAFFDQICVQCHNVNGYGSGAINLQHPSPAKIKTKLQTVTEMVNAIKAYLPISDQDIVDISTFLAVQSGNAENGKLIFNLECAKCHIIGRDYSSLYYDFNNPKLFGAIQVLGAEPSTILYKLYTVTEMRSLGLTDKFTENQFQWIYDVLAFISTLPSGYSPVAPDPLPETPENENRIAAMARGQVHFDNACIDCHHISREVSYTIQDVGSFRQELIFHGQKPDADNSSAMQDGFTRYPNPSGGNGLIPVGVITYDYKPPSAYRISGILNSDAHKTIASGYDFTPLTDNKTDLSDLSIFINCFKIPLTDTGFDFPDNMKSPGPTPDTNEYPTKGRQWYNYLCDGVLPAEEAPL